MLHVGLVMLLLFTSAKMVTERYTALERFKAMENAT